jgi:hypothetical protein
VQPWPGSSPPSRAKVTTPALPPGGGRPFSLSGTPLKVPRSLFFTSPPPQLRPCAHPRLQLRPSRIPSRPRQHLPHWRPLSPAPPCPAPDAASGFCAAHAAPRAAARTALCAACTASRAVTPLPAQYVPRFHAPPAPLPAPPVYRSPRCLHRVQCRSYRLLRGSHRSSRRLYTAPRAARTASNAARTAPRAVRIRSPPCLHRPPPHAPPCIRALSCRHRLHCPLSLLPPSLVTGGIRPHPGVATPFTTPRAPVIHRPQPHLSTDFKPGVAQSPSNVRW